MTEFGSLFTSYSGLDAHRRRLDVIGDNIANVDTEGYHRQRVGLEPVAYAKSGVHAGRYEGAGGVDAAEVQRLRDINLEAHARRQSGVAADRTATAATLGEVERILGGLDEGGLRNRLTEFFNSFDDLANTPEDGAMRSIVLQQAESVAQGFTRTADDIDHLHRRTTEMALDQVREINMLADQIAELNGQVTTASTAGSQPNTLLDQRDILVTRLAKLADIQVAEKDSGQIVVSIDGHLLVSGNSASAVAAQLQADPTLAAIGYQRHVLVGGSGRELTVGGGELAASLRAISQLIPDARIELDSLRDDLVTQVNALHQSGVGLDAGTGRDIFELPASTTSGGLEISPDVAGQPDRVAAAAAGAGALDTSNAEALAALGEDPSGPVAGYIAMVGDLAAVLNTADAAARGSNAAAALAESLALAAGGVSLDQEMTDLITAQRAYEASARLMTAIDEMLQTLIGRTGIVGR